MARTLVVTILFVDLVASTERRARLGDDAFDEFSRRYLVALEAAIVENEGRNIASAGDGLMVVFPHSVADAIACATTMHRSAAQLDPQDPPQLRIGISSGEVAEDGDGYSGMPIVEAARLEARAAPGQTLAHSIVRTLVGTRRAFRFRDVGALTLKGIPAPLSTVEVIDEEVLDAPPARPGQPSTDAAPLPADKPSGGARTPKVRIAIAAGAVAVIVIAAVVVGVLATRSHPKAKVVVAPPAGIPAPKGYTPIFTSSGCPASVLSVASDATCGQLVVPENRAKPNGRKVSLLVTSAPPRLPGPTIAPTIDVCDCEDLGSSLSRDHSELIHVAIRGYENSDPELTCPEVAAAVDAAITKPVPDSGSITAQIDAMGKCYTRTVAAGIDPAQYNAGTAAQDLTDLMYVMHIPQANFVASEDTTAEVFAVLRRLPNAVRSMTLDNPSPPGATTITDSVGDLSGALDRFSALCTADAICNQTFPHLGADWTKVFLQLETSEPTVATANPSDPSAPQLQVRLDGTHAADALGQALGDPSTYSLLPAAITQTAGQPEAAILAAQADYSPANEPWGAEASFECSYEIHTLDRQAQLLEGQTLPQLIRSPLLLWPRWCQVWKVPNIAPTLSQPVVSNIPALLFRGNLAAVGNPNWIPTLERGLSNAQSVIFPTLGRNLLENGPPCLSTLRRQFLANPNAPLATAACAKQSPAIQFVAPS